MQSVWRINVRLLADMFDYGFEQFGKFFRYNVFWDTGYVTKDPNVVKAVLATDFANYEKGATTTRFGCSCISLNSIAANR